MNLESSKIVQTFAKTEAGVGIRLVSALRNHGKFVFVDEANRIELRTFNNNNEVGLELVQPDVQVTCITTLGLNYILLGCENGEVLLYDHVGHYECYKHKAHSEAVSQVKSHPSSEFLFFVSGSASGSVKFWYVAKTVPPFWSQIWSHDNVHLHPITALAFVSNSEDIMVGSCGSEVC
jgi:WD40 repeat protein